MEVGLVTQIKWSWRKVLLSNEGNSIYIYREGGLVLFENQPRFPEREVGVGRILGSYRKFLQGPFFSNYRFSSTRILREPI